jgi:spore maturation protein CgeB
MKILHISLGKHQTSQSKALQDIASEYIQIDWTSLPTTLDKAIMATLQNFAPDLTFMQLQREGLVSPHTLQAISGKKYNWTGDVRTPIPQWYKTLAPYFDATLFSNGNDVAEFKRLGLRAEFLNIGFEEKDYNLDSERIDSGVIFMGNNYGSQFPLSQFRANMVNSIREIEVYGAGWNRGENLNENPTREAAIYRGCKIAINLSHFDYDRYSSDRMLRIMACGAFCLSHHYQGIEKDFEIGVDLVTWRTIPELQSLITYYLKPENEMERNAIAANGYEKVWANHKWSDRIKELISLT